MKTLQTVLTLIAILFGLLTIFAGTRVLLGADPGYIVYKPLLIYNAFMGLFYFATGIIAWRNIKRGMIMAAVILILNLVVLSVIYLLHSKGYSIAVESLRAMSLRTVVWLVLFTGFWWLNRKNRTDIFK